MCQLESVLLRLQAGFRQPVSWLNLLRQHRPCLGSHISGKFLQIKTISLFSTLLSAQLTSYAGNKPSGVGGNYVLCARCAFVLGLDVFCSANCGKFDETALKFAYTYTQVISLEGWVDIMYFVQDAHSFWDWIYFVALIVVSRVAENARRKSSFYRENPPAQLLSSKTYYYYTQTFSI